MARTSDEERQAFLEQIKKDFDERLARIAADPAAWLTFVEQVAVFGARYSLVNQMLLWAQAEQRGIQPRFFLPFGNKAGTSGWKKVGRTVRKGERAFHVWAPIRRRPNEQEAQQREAAGHKVIREPDGRPAVQLVGFGLAATFEVSQTDGEPFEPPTVQRIRRQKVAGGALPQLLTGEDPTGAYHDIVDLIKDEGYEFGLAAPGSSNLGTANGRTVKGPGIATVWVRDDVDAAQRIKTTVHDPLTAPIPRKPESLQRQCAINAPVSAHLHPRILVVCSGHPCYRIRGGRAWTSTGSSHDGVGTSRGSWCQQWAQLQRLTALPCCWTPPASQ